MKYIYCVHIIHIIVSYNIWYLDQLRVYEDNVDDNK